MTRILSWLMASSSYQLQASGKQDIAYLREAVFRASLVVTPMSLLCSVVYFLYIGLWLLPVLELVLAVLMLVNAFLLIARNVRLISPLASLLVSMGILVATVFATGADFIYWSYAFPVASYLLVSSREALRLNLVWSAVIGAVAALFFSPLATMSFVGGLIAASMMLHMLMLILESHEQQLKDQAVRDPLTQALNRRAMLEYLEDALDRQRRYQTPASIVLIDIDRFKDINDTFGHREGDQVLINLVRVLKNRLRASDKVCRHGGEEFVLLLPNTNLQQAFAVADAIRDTVASTHLTLKREVTISCGVAECKADGSIEEWIHRGDMALYEAKNKGRNRVSLEKCGAVA